MGAVFSYGQDPRWRRALVAAIDPRPGQRMLDVATRNGARRVRARPWRVAAQPLRPARSGVTSPGTAPIGRDAERARGDRGARQRHRRVGASATPTDRRLSQGRLPGHPGRALSCPAPAGGAEHRPSRRRPRLGRAALGPDLTSGGFVRPDRLVGRGQLVARTWCRRRPCLSPRGPACQPNALSAKCFVRDEADADERRVANPVIEFRGARRFVGQGGQKFGRA
jgi:hypothetical protein